MLQQKKIERKNKILKVCSINIAVTFILGTVKVVLGILSHSTALVLDAVSYYTDVLAVAIIMAGAFFYAKEPDEKHPFGYGRIEYVATLIMSLFFLSIGLDAMAGAIYNLFSKASPKYSWTTLIILAVTIVLKALVGRYTKANGISIGSDSLSATGNIAIRKAKTSTATIVSGIILLMTGISLDKLLAIFFAFLVLRASIKLTKKEVDNILGTRITPAVASAIKKTIASFPEVRGAYDLVLHNYGPGDLQGSVHIEVDESLSMDSLDTLIRDIRDKVVEEHAVDLTGISIYSVEENAEQHIRYREEIRRIALAQEAMNMHGFYMNDKTQKVSFDVLYHLENPKRHEEFAAIRREVEKMLPGYEIKMTMDLNIS